MADRDNYFGYDPHTMAEVAIVNGLRVASCSALLPEEARQMFWSKVLLQQPPNVVADWLISLSNPAASPAVERADNG